ncbi:uncharacterized protein LOC144633237 isoform X2 [Oculina patagonica]
MKVDRDDRRDCGYSHDKSQCEAHGCCFYDYLDGSQNVCFYPALAKCYNVPQDQRTDCGNMGQYDCMAKGCCYDSGVNAGVPWCHYDEFYTARSKLSDKCAYVEDAAKEDCGQNAGSDPDTCTGNAYGCCYNNIVPQGVPHCFKPDSECMVISQDQRVDCGFHGVTPSQCKEKGCCYQDNVPSGVPLCFYSKSQMDLPEDCAKVENAAKEDCGQYGVTAYMCREKGCCYNNYVPEGVPHCFKPYSQCLDINEDQRLDCGFAGMTPSQCKEKECCYKDNVPSGVPHCYYSKKVMDFVAALSEDCKNVENSFKEDCRNNSNDADACKANGCCYNSYVPEGVPHCYKPYSECLAINESKRIDCGFKGMTQIQCKEKQCCYQDNVPSGVPYCFYSKNQLATFPTTKPSDDQCLVNQDQRIDCGFHGMTPSQCKEKQCCYQDNVPSGVPHCFHNKTQMDGECLVNQDQRLDCGFEGMTKIQCKEKQCCYQDNVPSGVPNCFYNKTYMAALPTTKPTVAPTTSRADKCNSIRSEVQINCGWKDLTREECEALGCCYGRPWYMHPCFYIDRDECNVVNVTERKLCFLFEVGKESCESKDNCCFDDTDYGFPTVKCFAAQQVCSIDEISRRPCGNANDERSCTTLGCCFDSFNSKCYYPSDYNFAGDDCLAVEPSQRRDCGPGVDKATCVEKGCCYDEADSDVARIRCYYSIKNVQCSVDVRRRNQCGSPGVNRTTCEEMNCCFDPQFYGDYTIYCYYPETEEPTPQGKTCSTGATRLDCGKFLISADECNSRGCCYEDSDVYYGCYKTQEMIDDICDGVDVAHRYGCGWPDISQQHCEGRGCCYDTKEYTNRDAKHCFYPKDHSSAACYEISPSDGTSCASGDFSRQFCESLGCCFHETTVGVPEKWCYYPPGFTSSKSSTPIPTSSSSIPALSSSIPASSSASPASSSSISMPSSPVPSPTSSSQVLPTTPSPPFPSAEITVLCEDEYMTVVIAKSLLPGVDRGHLRLLDASCTATETSTHFSLTTPLTGCLTAVHQTPTSVICSNRVLEIPSDINDVVTRIKEVEISFSCQYFKSGLVSSVGWKPENNVIVFNDEGQRNFTMALNMFPDSNFTTPHSQNDFPVVVQIQQHLFFEVSATTGGLQVSLRADHCYATPTQDRNSPVKHDLIQDGCPTDPSVQFLATSSDSVQRFTFEAFQFIAAHSFVFVHCHVIICDGADLLSECKKVCPSGGMRKRQAPGHVTDKYLLVQGPILLAREKQDGNQMELSDKNGPSAASIMVLALACAVFLAGTVLILARKSRDMSARYIRLAGAESPITQ